MKQAKPGDARAHSAAAGAAAILLGASNRHAICRLDQTLSYDRHTSFFGEEVARRTQVPDPIHG